MKREIKVSATYLTKKYAMYKKKSDKRKILGDDSEENKKEFWALRGVSFEVFSGEAVGLIGTNGSGKSTLSNIIAGISKPTTGEILINGKTSIIAIGTGLKKELTGRQNINLKCLLSGMSSKEIDNITDDIIAFADLDDFIDQPLKNYSSGMKSRLGFAISVHSNPDILIIDEALSVGDDTFYQRCVDKIFDFKAQGKTIFFVSHSTKQVSKLCDKVIWIHEGEMKKFGPAKEVIADYKNYVKWYKELPKKEQKKQKKEQKKERKNFSIDNYYEQVLAKDTTVDRQKLEYLFYPLDQKPDKLSFSAKLMIVFVFIALSTIAIYYIPGRPIIEIILDAIS